MNQNETKENPATEEEVLQILLERVKNSDKESAVDAVRSYADFRYAVRLELRVESLIS